MGGKYFNFVFLFSFDYTVLFKTKTNHPIFGTVPLKSECYNVVYTRGIVNWIYDETLFRVFHITSKTNPYFRRKLRRKLG